MPKTGNRDPAKQPVDDSLRPNIERHLLEEEVRLLRQANNNRAIGFAAMGGALALTVMVSLVVLQKDQAPPRPQTSQAEGTSDEKLRAAEERLALRLSQIQASPAQLPSGVAQALQRELAEVRVQLASYAEALRESDAAKCRASGIDPGTSPDDCAQLIEALRAARFGVLAYNVPSPMVRGEPTKISAIQASPPAASATSEAERLKGELGTLRGSVEIRQTRAFATMSATLAGETFSVTAHSPEKQTVLPGNDARWDWTVVPNEGGFNKVLTITTFGHLRVDGSERAPITIKAYQAPIFVTVAPWDRVKDLAADVVTPLSVILTGLAAFGGFVIARWRGWIG